MDYSFLKGLYNEDGDLCDEGLFVFIGKDTIIKFQDSDELEAFANKILKSLPEIRGEV
jgi:hypothetical protein